MFQTFSLTLHKMLVSRMAIVSDLDSSLDDGVGVFNSDNVNNLISSVQNFKKMIGVRAGPAAFKDGVVNEDFIQKSVNKSLLAEWLATSLDILDRAVIQVQSAVSLEPKILSLKKENLTLLREKVTDQGKIIDFQQKLMEETKTQVTSVAETVQKEVKSYAQAVKVSCDNALAPQQVRKVVEQIKDSDDRSRNLMIYGLVEEDEEKLEEKVGLVFSSINEKPFFSAPRRIGQKKEGTVRPVKISFTSSIVVGNIIKKSSQLKTVDGFDPIFIARDRSKEERQQRRFLVEELKRKRGEDSSQKYGIRNGKVVCLAGSTYALSFICYVLFKDNCELTARIKSGL